MSTIVIVVAEDALLPSEPIGLLSREVSEAAEIVADHDAPTLSAVPLLVVNVDQILIVDDGPGV